MRRFLMFISAAGLAMALAVSAQATEFSGSASFALSTLPGLVASGTGSGTSAPAGTITLPGGWAATGPVLITLAPTAAAPLSALNIQLTAPGPCSLTAAGGNAGGVGGGCGLGGTVNALVGGAPFLIVPFDILGQNGRLTFGPYGSYIDAQAWTTGTATVTINGVAQTTGNATTPGALSQMFGSDSRDAAGLGTVTLVAPAGLMSTLGGPFPLFVAMTLTFVPEPGTLLLLGSGIAGLAIIGRKRMSR